ncbi:hypothetical protein BGX26_010929 [Mortierella sp. AD094]|nr:hypothetical protein BGX26_010929 [Mortierella sp. AD094]
MASVESLRNGTSVAETAQETPQEDMASPIIPSDAESDSNEERHPTPSPSLTPPSVLQPTTTATTAGSTSAQNAAPAPAQPSFDRHERTPQRTLHVPASLRRNNSNNSFMAFNEIPSLPTFLNNCNLSQYLQSFNDAGATDDSMPLIIDFDDDELKSIMDAIPMKPFHAVTFRKGIRDLRERSRMGSMHFDNSQNSFMQPEPHSMLHYSHSQFFQQPSQPSQSSQLSQASYPSQSSSQPSRGHTYHHHGSSQTPGLYRQSSSSKSSAQRQTLQAGSSSHSQGYLPTPSQVLSAGSIYQYVGPAPKAPDGNHMPQSVPLFSQEQPAIQRSSSKSDRLKRRRSSSGTPPDMGLERSSPVLPEPSSFNSNSSSSWSNSTPVNASASNTQDSATREMIMHQALIYGKQSPSRLLTKYEHAINCAAQSLALEDPSLLTNKGLLWNKAKAKLLEEDYDYKRGKSRSKLPEAEKKKDHKVSKERLIQKREANASNAATLRLRRIASLGEHFHRKTADREALLAHLLRLESPEYKQKNPNTFEAEAKKARDDLARVENERQILSKELGSLKNKERKHQWYEKRKKHRVDNGEPSEQDDKETNAGTDAEADEEAETDTTVDPDGDASQRSVASRQGAADAVVSQSGVPKAESSPGSKPLTWKAHNPPAAATAKPNDSAKSPSRSKKHKDVFRASEYTPAVKT